MLRWNLSREGPISERTVRPALPGVLFERDYTWCFNYDAKYGKRAPRRRTGSLALARGPPDSTQVEVTVRSHPRSVCQSGWSTRQSQRPGATSRSSFAIFRIVIKTPCIVTLEEHARQGGSDGPLGDRTLPAQVPSQHPATVGGSSLEGGSEFRIRTPDACALI